MLSKIVLASGILFAGNLLADPSEPKKVWELNIDEEEREECVSEYVDNLLDHHWDVNGDDEDVSFQLLGDNFVAFIDVRNVDNSKLALNYEKGVLTLQPTDQIMLAGRTAPANILAEFVETEKLLIVTIPVTSPCVEPDDNWKMPEGIIPIPLRNHNSHKTTTFFQATNIDAIRLEDAKIDL